MKWNLQRFADVVVVDDNGNEPPIAPIPVPTPTTVMPSHVAPEAWKNVEDMLVTLSNNVRVQISTLSDAVKEIREAVSNCQVAIDSGLAELRSSMAEFNQLLADATVEVPADDHVTPEQKKNGKTGYLDRR